MKSNIKSLKQKIIESQIVSFDMFDTLVNRIFNHPEDLFLMIEKKWNIKNFVENRKEGQRLASIEATKKFGYPHANLDEIYYYISKNYYKSQNINWEQIKDYELQLEKDSIVQNKEIYELYLFAKKNKKRVIVISDMYISCNNLKEILENCKYNNLDKIYVSADIRKTKYNGDLFDYALKTENIDPRLMIHIGDNQKDDVEMAKVKGIKTFYYIPNIDLSRTRNNNIWNSISKGASRILGNNKKSYFWYYLGAKAAGNLYIGLTKWFLEQIEKKQYEKIYFLSRDGYILYHILKNMGYKNIEYVYTSRRALLLAGITKLDEETLKLLPPYTYGQSVEEILKYLDFINIDELVIKKAGFSGKDDIIKSNADYKKMKKIFKLSEKYILDICKKEREYAQEYFNSIDLLSNNALVFDCGWNGSSQFLLDKVLKNIPGYSGSIEFLYAGIQDNLKSRKQLYKKNYKTYLFQKGENQKLAKILAPNIALLEFFFSAPHSSVWKYGKEGPEFETIEKEHSHKKEILDGILDYMKLMNSFITKYNLSILVEEAISPIIELIKNPSEEEAETIGNLSNIDGFANKSNSNNYLAHLTLTDIIKNPNIEVYWPVGIIKRRDINKLVKLYIYWRYGIVKNVLFDKKSPFLISKIKNIMVLLYKGGIPGVINHIALKREKGLRKCEKSYEEWILKNEKSSKNIESIKEKVFISIVVPVYNVETAQLTACIESVIAQTYQKWELCLIDDASTWENVRIVLKKYENNPKIKIKFREKNGHISRATNTGIEMAEGDYIGFLDCDDILASNALHEMAKVIIKHPEYDFIYSDEDKLSADGKQRHSPFFKPDWSPDTFMSLMYTCHFAIYRRSIVNEIGGIRVGFEGAQDYDFTLRFVEKTNFIGHIPKILYHWRQREESLAANPESKPYALKSVKKLKQEALKRRGLNGEVYYIPDMYQYGVNYFSKNESKVSIIIIARDKPTQLLCCLKEIRKKTLYFNMEIIVIDNNSSLKQQKDIQDICKKFEAIYYLEKRKTTSGSLYNQGAKLSKGEIVVFLDVRLQVSTVEWIDYLAGICQLDHVGAVGVKILYNFSNKIRHCGIVQLKGKAVYAFHGLDDSGCYYYGRNRMDYNYFAVSGGCLAIEKEKFIKVGMFQEKYDSSECDIDLCERLSLEKYYNVVKNNIIFFTTEKYSKNNIIVCKGKRKDPFYNSNLSKIVEFEL